MTGECCAIVTLIQFKQPCSYNYICIYLSFSFNKINKLNKDLWYHFVQTQNLISKNAGKLDYRFWKQGYIFVSTQILVKNVLINTSKLIVWNNKNYFIISFIYKIPFKFNVLHLGQQWKSCFVRSSPIGPSVYSQTPNFLKSKQLLFGFPHFPLKVIHEGRAVLPRWKVFTLFHVFQGIP